MALTPKNGDLTAGLAGQRSETIGASPDPLITGDFPAVSSDIYPMAADLVLEGNTVVGFDADGNLVEPVRGSADPADDIAPIGVAKYAYDNDGGADGDQMAEVYRSGVFNPDLLVWPVSYATAEQKRRAFEGAPSPTMIFIRKPTTMTVS